MGSLQQIREIRLTTNGRDRARGRVLIDPPPEPGEDDGRPISQLTLSKSAKAIAEHFTITELPTFLREAGIPEEFVESGASSDKAGYLLGVLSRMLNAGAAARHVLRVFLGRWLADGLVVGPSDDLRLQMTRELARQGWHVRGDRLVAGTLPAGATAQSPICW